MKKTWIVLTISLITLATTVPAFASDFTLDEVRAPITAHAAAPVTSRFNATLDEIRAELRQDVDVVVFDSHQGFDVNEAHQAK